jgi:protein TonB
MKYFVFVISLACSTLTFSQKTDSLSKPASNAPVYRVVQIMPEFPGGKDSMNAFIKANLKYPRAAKENSKQGTVVIEFVIDTDGSLTDIKVKTAIYPLLDQEALRVVKLMPKYSPGKQAGKPVKVISSIPITFKMPDYH